MRKKYYFTYSILYWIICFFTIIIWHVLAGKSLIVSYDCLEQHYMGFLYVGQWIREFFAGIFSQGHPAFKMWDISIGYGSDVFATLPVYFCDPFYWLSALVPIGMSEGFFEFLILFKIYLCGVTFSVYALDKGNSENATLFGALVYAFAGSVFVGLLQTIFLSAMYLFPLVMLGADRLWKERRWGLYVFSLALSLITYFYCAYMIGILVAGYCLIKLFTEEEASRDIQDIPRLVLEFILYSVLALGVSAVFILPSVTGLIGAGRLGVDYYVSFFYDKDMYLQFITHLFDDQWVGMDSYIGINAIAAPCLIALFKNRGNRTLKCCFIILTVGLLLPYFGWMMNGFSYVTNRWSFAYSFCLAYIVTVELEGLSETFTGGRHGGNSAQSEYEMTDASDKKISPVPMLCAIIYISIVEFIYLGSDFAANITMVIVLAACIFAAVSPRLGRKAFWGIALVVTFVSFFARGFFFFSEGQMGWVKQNVESGEALYEVENSSGLSMLDEESLNESGRYDQYAVTRVKNASWYHGIGGMDFYVSLYNDAIDRFHNDIALLTSPWAYGYAGLNYRSELEALMGVDKFLILEGDESKIPYGYEDVLAIGETRDGVVYAYGATEETSLIHFFDKTVSEEYYNALNPIEKQQAMMQAVAVESGSANGSIQDISFDHEELPYEISVYDGVAMTWNGFYSEGKNSHIILDIPEVSDCEIYVYLDNLTFENDEDSTYRINIHGMCDDEASAEISSAVDGLNERHHMYGGKKNWLLNLGHTDKKIDGLRIRFEAEGYYNLDGIKVYTRSKEKVLKSIDGLNPVSGVEVSTNKISASVSATEDGVALVMVPYSSGWRAYDNGKKVSLVRADEAFIGIPLTAGDHEIVMKYRTPWLVPGMIVSALSLGIAIILWKRKANAEI